MKEKKIKRVICPYCGYVMPISYGSEAMCTGVYAKCKGKGCKKYFEIKIDKEIK